MPLSVDFVPNPDSIRSRFLILLMLSPGAVFYYGIIFSDTLEEKPWFCVSWVNASSVLTSYYLIQLLFAATQELTVRNTVTTLHKLGLSLMRVILMVHVGAVIWNETNLRVNAPCNRVQGTGSAQISSVAKVAAQISVATWVWYGSTWQRLASHRQMFAIGALLALPLLLLLLKEWTGQITVNADVLCYTVVFEVLARIRNSRGATDGLYPPHPWVLVPRFLEVTVEAESCPSLSRSLPDRSEQMNPLNASTLRERQSARSTFRPQLRDR